MSYELKATPKPAKRVKIRKCLKARKEPKAFQHRRVPEYQEWIRSYSCALLGKEPLGIPTSSWSVTECAHVKSRGAGGDDIGNCVPLCHYHHQQQHILGIRSFMKRYGIDLYAIAADLGRIYKKRFGASSSPPMKQENA